MAVSVFYISDKAFGHLVYLAQLRQYVKWGSQRVKGMSTFLNDLALENFDHKQKSLFIDTRPDLVRQRHADEIKYGRAPTWLHTRTRRARNLQLTDNTIEKYFRVALQMGITTSEHYIVGGPSMITPQPSVSLVLEGIGLEWITPAKLPTLEPKKNG